MTRILLAAVFGLVALTASAQEATVLRFYIVPKELGAHDTVRPKYVWPVATRYEAADYGLEDVLLVGAELTPTDHTTVAANLDVIAIPANLDSTIGLTALSTVQQKLEGLRIPSEWVTTDHTYRDVLRLTRKVFGLFQRFDGLFQRKFFETGITLDTRINQLTQAQRQALIDAATSLGLDTSPITGPMPIRQAIRILAQQLPSITMMGEVF